MEKARGRTLRTDNTLEELALAVDGGQDAGDPQALERALHSLEALEKGAMSCEQRALVHYYSANALAGLRNLQREGGGWWDQPLLEREMLQHRLALNELETTEAAEPLKRQVLTNLGNAFNEVGRFTEALALWNRALAQDAAFGMALANRGLGYFRFARHVQTAPEQSLLLRDSRESLRLALKAGVEEHAFNGIKAMYDHLSSMEDWAKFEAPKMPLPEGMPEVEREYRNWCRRNGLFLSPLNDLANMGGIEDVRDTLLLPNITVPVSEATSEPPAVYGMFNQAKEEFISARYLAFEAITERGREELHFADRGVALLDMLDYRLYRLWVERLKMSFLSAHAILDKLAYLMNDYWKFGLAPHEVSFGDVWYTGGRRRNGVSSKVKQLSTWPLQGLFWLSRDFYGRSDVPASVAPEARMLHEIRNHIAHKYLRVHDDLIGHLRPDRQEQPRDFSFQVTGSELEEYTLRLLRLVRSAMMYLGAAIEHEESERSQGTGDGLVAPLLLFPVDEDGRL